MVGEGVPTLHAGNVCWASSCHLRLERRVEISFFRNLRSKLYFPERNSKGNGIGNSRNGTSLEKMLKSPHCLTAWTQKAKVQQE